MDAAVRRPRASREARNAEVRTRLLDAAERLFARHGIEAVSFNQIARAADQRNSTVIQYHFGNKTALLEAIAQRRMREVNEHRLRLLAGVNGRDRHADLERVAQAMVLPFAEHLTHEGGSFFVRFAAQMYADPNVDFFRLIAGAHDEGMREAGRVAAEILSDLPPDVVRHRLAIVTTLIFSTMGDREKLREAGRHVGVARLHTGNFVADLVSMIVGALDAPYRRRADPPAGVAAP